MTVFKIAVNDIHYMLKPVADYSESVYISPTKSQKFILFSKLFWIVHRSSLEMYIIE